ncbi:DUF3568 family protein [Desulfonatronospira sp.]|uniref:DUF3568 family protein n=1 Tax=Desulfonatronospira sp. TaxID=1962951 RepID=UPI0025C633CD|nr:DUF3568 family protein [Desulfonatronospira sp.]
MTATRQKLYFLLILFLCLNLSGCLFALGGAAGGGAAIYHKGWLREKVASDMYNVHEATLKAMEVKNISLEEETEFTDRFRIRGKYMDGTNVWITVKHLTARSSQVNIRVGVLGDESRSRAIWDEARRHM